MNSILLGVAARTALLFAFWLLLVDATDEANMLAGAVCAALGSLLASAVRTHRSVRARLEVGMLRYAYRPLLLLLVDTVRVARALLIRALRRTEAGGHLRAVRYDAVSEEPSDVARRILTEWGASLGPNRYVIGVDTERRLLLIHELVPCSGPLDPMELG
jgi:multisubunit Na+/H+ antiporter MnhE subunit